MPTFAAPDGTQLHYTDEGTGPVVLALAGLTRTGGDFTYVAPHLGCRLIRLDYRGRGNSAWADPASYTIPTEAQDALALLDHLSIDKAAILGTSRGGLIAMTLAALAPDRLTGVALNDIGPEIATQGLAVIAGYIGRRPGAKTHAEAAAIRADLMAGFENVPQSRWDEEVRLHYVEKPDGLDITYDPALAEAFRAALDQPPVDLWPFFEALPQPLCLIRGANSDLLTAETFAQMQDRRPGAIAATVPDRGHVPFLDEPEALTALQDWIARL